MSGSYVQRAIDVTITLGTGTFGQTGMNTVKLSGLRVAASIAKATMPSGDVGNIRIYGVSPSIANTVSTLGVTGGYWRLNNTVMVEAGEKGKPLSCIYKGQITNAWQDFDGMPDTFLNIAGSAPVLGAIIPSNPHSYPGTSEVATIINGLATESGYGFENGGVTAIVSNQYLSGTAVEQMQAVARAANCEIYLDTATAQPGTIAIWPRGKTRTGQAPLISAETGLIGYPKYRDQGMSFRCLLNPNIRLGGMIEMRSSVGGKPIPQSGATLQQAQQAGANGTWQVSGSLSYDIASEIPNGPWFCDVMCQRVHTAAP